MARNLIQFLKLSLFQRRRLLCHTILEIIIPLLIILFLFLERVKSHYKNYKINTEQGQFIMLYPFNNSDLSYYSLSFEYRDIYLLMCEYEERKEYCECLCNNYSPLYFEFTYGYFLLGSCIRMNNNIIAFIGRDINNTEIYDSIKSKINETFYSMYYEHDTEKSYQLLFVDYSDNLEFEKNVSSELYQKKRLNQSHISSGICAGIEIKNSTQNYNIALRFEDNYYLENYFNFSNISAIASTLFTSYRVSNTNSFKDIESFSKYTNNGFFHLQNLIAYLILKNETGSTKPLIINSMNSIDDTFERDVFIQRLIDFLPVTLLSGFFWYYHRFCLRLFNERKDNFILKIRQFNVSLWTYWISIFMEYLFLSLLISIFCSIVMASIYHYISYGYFFLFFMTYLFSLSSLALLLSSIIDSKRILILFSFIIYFMSHVIGFFLNYLKYSSSIKLGLSFLCPISGISILNSYTNDELNLMGMKIDSILDEQSNISLPKAYVILFFSSVIISFIGIIIHNIKTHPLFNYHKLLNYHFLKGCFFKNQVICNSSCFNFPIPQKIKDFKERDINFDSLNQNEIFVLFGEEGCYKSELCKTIPWMTCEGINNESLRFDTFLSNNIESSSRIMSHQNQNITRRKIITCEKNSNFIPYLTVKEYIEFFCNIAGIDPSNDQINELIVCLNLKDSLNKNLSKLTKTELYFVSLVIALSVKESYITIENIPNEITLILKKKIWKLVKTQRDSNNIIIFNPSDFKEAQSIGDNFGLIYNEELFLLSSSFLSRNIYQDNLNEEEKINDFYTLVLDENTFVIGQRFQSEEAKEEKKLFCTEEKEEEKKSAELTINFEHKSNEMHIEEMSNYFEHLDDSIISENFKQIRLKFPFVHLAFQCQLISVINYVLLHLKKGFKFNSIRIPSIEDYYYLIKRKKDPKFEEIEDKKIKKISKMPNINTSNPSRSLLFLLIKKELLFWKNNVSLSFRSLLKIFISALVLILFFILPYFIFRSCNFPDSPPKLLSQNFIENQTYFINKAIPESCQDDQVNNDYTSLLQYFQNETSLNINIFPEFLNCDIDNRSSTLLFYLSHHLNLKNETPMFGSSQINKLLSKDNQYMYALFVNPTSPHSSGIYSSYFINKLFKFATKSPKEINFINYPIPVTYQSKYILQSRIQLIMFACILILITMVIISFFKFSYLEYFKKSSVISVYGLFSFRCFLYGFFIDFFKIIILHIPLILLQAFDVGFKMDFLILIFPLLLYEYCLLCLVFHKNRKFLKKIFLSVMIFLGYISSFYLLKLNSYESECTVIWIYKKICLFIHLVLSPIEIILYFLLNIFSSNQIVLYSFTGEARYRTYLRSFQDENFFVLTILAIYFNLSIGMIIWMTRSKTRQYNRVFKIKPSYNLDTPRLTNISHADSERHYVESERSQRSIRTNSNFRLPDHEYLGQIIIIYGKDLYKKKDFISKLFSDDEITRTETFNLLGINLSNYSQNEEILFSYYLSSYNLVSFMTIKENLEYFSKLVLNYNQTPNLDNEISHVIDLFELSEVQNVKVDSLRDEIVQRTCVAISFLGNPNLIILDDFMANLNWNWRNKIIKIILEHAKSKKKLFILQANQLEYYLPSYNFFKYFNVEEKKFEPPILKARINFNIPYELQKNQYMINFTIFFTLAKRSEEAIKNSSEEIKNESPSFEGAFNLIKSDICPILERNSENFKLSSNELLNLYFNFTKTNMNNAGLTSLYNFVKRLKEGLNILDGIGINPKIVLGSKNKITFKSIIDESKIGSQQLWSLFIHNSKDTTIQIKYLKKISEI